MCASTVSPWTVTRLKSAPIARTSSSASTAANAFLLSAFLNEKRFGTMTGAPVSVSRIASRTPPGLVQPTEYCVSASLRNWLLTAASLARRIWPALSGSLAPRMPKGLVFMSVLPFRVGG